MGAALLAQRIGARGVNYINHPAFIREVLRTGTFCGKPLVDWQRKVFEVVLKQEERRWRVEQKQKRLKFGVKWRQARASSGRNRAGALRKSQRR